MKKVTLVFLIIFFVMFPCVDCFASSMDEIEKQQEEYGIQDFLNNSKEYVGEAFDDIDIKDVYAGTNAEYEYKASKNRKYTSISIKLYVIDSETVINYYKEIAKIEGVIML